MRRGGPPLGTQDGIDARDMAEYRIAPTRHAPAEARQRLRQHLPAGSSSEQGHDAALAVSELVTFGLRERLYGSQGDAVFTLRVHGDGRRLRVELHHGGPAEGSGWHALLDSLFELVVLNVVTSDWGITDDGTQVWFSVGPPEVPREAKR